MDELEIRVRAARAWLRDGYVTSDKVKALHCTVASTRGTDYADKLRDEMRVQWRRRREWLEPGT